MALSYLENLGPATVKKLINKLGSAEAVFKASVFDLSKLGVAGKISLTLQQNRRKIDPEKIVKELKKENIQTVSLWSKDYPVLLKETYDPPLILFYRGNLSALQTRHLLAVVGSRKISAYATGVMPELLEPVIKQGVAIVSGLAYGVDQLAHQLALKNHGLTIGVLGCGLSWQVFYPQSNLNLAKKMLEQGGVLLSEFPPATAVKPFNFPRRNRLISGLAQAVLIVEASAKSGALITAAYGLEQNKEILALPQNIQSANALGVNRLIQQGAKMVLTTDDILEAFNLKQIEFCLKTRTNPALLNSLNFEEKTIYQYLSEQPVHIDKIIEDCNLEAGLALSTVMLLELNGLVKNLGQNYYVKL